MLTVVKPSDEKPTPIAGPQLIGQLLDRHAAALELYARQLCDCAEDVVQEAFIELARSEKVPVEPAPWLFRVVRNRAISAQRSRHRRTHYETAASNEKEAWFEADSQVHIDSQSAADALADLPVDQREAIVARIWGGLTFQQVGDLLGVTDSTAHRRYEAGLLSLRKILGVPCPSSNQIANS